MHDALQPCDSCAEAIHATLKANPMCYCQAASSNKQGCAAQLADEAQGIANSLISRGCSAACHLCMQQQHPDTTPAAGLPSQQTAAPLRMVYTATLPTVLRAAYAVSIAYCKGINLATSHTQDLAAPESRQLAQVPPRLPVPETHNSSDCCMHADCCIGSNQAIGSQFRQRAGASPHNHKGNSE
jgi:hypothetical protein